MINSKYKKQST